MKNLILSALLFFTLVNCSAQIQKTSLPELINIGEVKSGLVFVASLNYIINTKDTSYTIFFNNDKYKTITDIQSIVFNEDGGVLNSLYQILNETFEMEKGKQNSLKLGDDDLVITSNKTMGVKYIDIMKIKNGAYFSLTRKQLDKLFNKK